MSLQSLHDKMLEEMPERAQHDSAECPFCNPQNSHETGGNMSETFTKDEVQAQVAAAVADATKAISEELEAFKASQEAAEVEARIAEAKAELEERIAALQADLDAKVIEAETAKAAHAELVALLEAEEARVAEEAAMAERRDARVAAVSEAASFSEDYIAANADRWASLDDDTFEALLADYKAVAEKASASTGATKIPAKTALVASRDEASGTGSAVKALSELRRVKGFDPREMVR